MEDKPPFRDELAIKFRADIETIAASLIGFCGLTHSKAIHHLDRAPAVVGFPASVCGSETSPVGVFKEFSEASVG